MKALVPCGRLQIEVEAETQIELVEEIGRAQEVFSDSQCGQCGSDNIRYRVRRVDDFTFPELSCQDCFAKLVFGQEKKGGKIFPVRKVNASGQPDRKNGVYDREHHGWHKFKKDDDNEQVQEGPDGHVDQQGLAQDRRGGGGGQGRRRPAR